ncbi:unnamed protein product [Rangifer tarandus platyrhynchus]|uniref:Uncharacterized protein n=2 Tax=Rangifer tarandus platyrhynchus TaxID=3082113 RepID=A0ABN8ZZB2_RANTA|nr:unnamed protein product [Rangifer tarandus platyrhynchus]
MRRVGWLDRAGPHWRHRGQRPSRAAQTQAPRRQAQCGRSRLAQSCSLHASGAVPGKDHSTHRSAVEKGADAQLAAEEKQHVDEASLRREFHSLSIVVHSLGEPPCTGT